MRHVNTSTGWTVLAAVAVLVASACESSPPVRTPELSPGVTATLSRLPADQQARAEYLLRERPRIDSRLVIYIDGERFVPADAPESPYEVINPDRIDTIEVLRGDAAERRVGPEAREGLVWITTKKQPAAAAGTQP